MSYPILYNSHRIKYFFDETSKALQGQEVDNYRYEEVFASTDQQKNIDVQSHTTYNHAIQTMATGHETDIACTSVETGLIPVETPSAQRVLAYSCRNIHENASGILQDSLGHTLLGLPVDTPLTQATTLQALKPIHITKDYVFQATQNIGIQANINAKDTPYTVQHQAYNRHGKPFDVKTIFSHNGTTYQMQVQAKAVGHPTWYNLRLSTDSHQTYSAHPADHTLALTFDAQTQHLTHIGGVSPQNIAFHLPDTLNADYPEKQDHTPSIGLNLTLSTLGNTSHLSKVHADGIPLTHAKGFILKEGKVFTLYDSGHQRATHTLFTGHIQHMNAAHQGPHNTLIATDTAPLTRLQPAKDTHLKVGHVVVSNTDEDKTLNAAKNLEQNYSDLMTVYIYDQNIRQSRNKALDA